jgi:hypothetical protein
VASKLNRRLERLEAELTPGDEDVMTLFVTHIGDKEHPEPREIRVIPASDWRRRWPRTQRPR